jgi:hypothetical protein
MSHLAITIKWLLSIITGEAKSETTTFLIPDGISIADFNYDIRYLGKRMLLETRGRVNLLSYIDLKNQKLVHLRKNIDEARALLAAAMEKLNAMSGRFIYKEQIGGYEDCDDTTNRVTFKGSTARAVVHELNLRLGEILTSKEIADAILERTGKSYKPENIKSTVNTVIKRKFEAARAEKGFPYEIRSVKKYQGTGRTGQTITHGKNSGYGLFKIVK